MKCPVCKRLLEQDEYYYTCRTLVNIFGLNEEKIRHYTYNKIWNREIIYIMPYRIVTYYKTFITTPKFSLIEKYVKNSWKIIVDTREINIGSIAPSSEEDLLNRIKTILVFS